MSRAIVNGVTRELPPQRPDPPKRPRKERPRKDWNPIPWMLLAFGLWVLGKFLILLSKVHHP